jgi:hypothetical protein
MEGIHIVPTLTLNSNRNLIDWRNRDQFPPDEPVTIWGSDTGGNLRSRKIAWGDIEGDIANTLDGPIQIQEVTRDADRPIHDEELIPQQPRSLRPSIIPAWPTERRSENPNRWALQLCRNPGPPGRRWDAGDLASELGVLPQAILDLQVHEDWRDEEWLMPERDAFGDIIGISVRQMFPLPDDAGRLNTKGFRKGGRRGLYYTEYWQQDDGAVFSPEGFSDTAACLSMGLKTVGRPSASAGKEHLLFLLADYEFTEPLIIVPDRDVNDKGKNVGLEGAYKAAKYLAARLQRPILVALPPDGLKDTRAWLQSFCQGDLSPERLAAAREVFLNHVQNTAETIHPGRHYELHDDDRLELSLDEWREQMQDARIASIDRPTHYADFSPTGSGKSFADRALIRTALDVDKSVLLVVPTHANCTEEVRQLSEAGIDAVAYPELSRDTCQRHWDASFAVSQGLDLVRSVCTACPLFHNKTCVYRQQIDRARQAQVAVCTTARLGMDAAVSESRDVISVHEVADSAICGQYSLERAKIEQARRVLLMISRFVHGRDAHTDDAIRRTQETRAYIQSLVALCDLLLESLRSGTRTEGSTPAQELPPGYWVKFVREWLQENTQSDRFHEDCEANDFQWPDDRIDGNTLRGLEMIAQGESWDVMTWPVETTQRRCSEARIIVQRRLQFQDHQVWWWQDATGDLQQLQRLIGRRVEDMTPDGRLELKQSVEVVPIDISRRTAVSRVVDAIRMTIMTSGCQRLGVIGHKIHVDQLTSEDSQLLVLEIRERIHMMSYYGAGLDRASNRWLGCDRLLILGTPRIGDDAVRAELWRAGEQEAAAICEPGWGDYSWQSRVVGDDEPTIVGGQAYSDPTWHQACLRVTRAAMRQALGRARAILGHGIPATIWTTDELREYPVRVEPQIHSAVIDAVQVLWIANLEPESQPRRRGVIVTDGRVWLTGAEVARRLNHKRNWAALVLPAAEEQGFVERAQRRQGWSIASTLRGGVIAPEDT